MNETIKHKGYTIELWRDIYASYSDDEHLGTFYSAIPRYCYPDDADMCDLLDDDDRIPNEYIYLVVFAYIHGGVALSVSQKQFDVYDSGLGGIMAVSYDKARQWLKPMPDDELEKHAKEILASEVEELNEYCNGNIWGFTVYNKEGEEHLSRGNIIGSELALEEAEDEIAYLEKEDYVNSFKEALKYDNFLIE